MTRNSRPPKHFDMPKVHLSGDEVHVLPKSTDPEEIAWRTKNPGLDRLRYQHFGLHIATELTRPSQVYEDKNIRTYVNGRVALALFNTSWFAFQEEPEDVMRNRLLLPLLAEEDPSETYYQTEHRLHLKAYEDLSLARVASVAWMNRHTQGKNIVKSAKTFAQSVGNSALKLASLGLTHDNESTIYDMQVNARLISQQLLDQSREAHRATGVDPSLKQMATDPIERIFPIVPGADEETIHTIHAARQALIQARTPI